jgi:hypothetical protein
MYLFLALILKMGHDKHDTFKKYCSRDPMCHAPFYSRVVRHNRFFTSSISYILKTTMPLTGCGNYEEFLII